MPNFYRVTLFVVLAAIILSSSPHTQAETLKFAWPDGASAKVRVRSTGKQVEPNKTDTWDMSCDFNMHVKRSNDRLVVSRNDHSGWKGTFAPPLGAGAEQFVDMIPTVIVTKDGQFVGIEGQETARKLMIQTVEQAGALTQMERNALATLSTDAALEAIVRDNWSALAVPWRSVELTPGAGFDFTSLAQVPQLGGGEIEIKGSVKFVKEAPCEAPRNDQRCIHFYSESGGDKAQVRKIAQKMIEQAEKQPLVVTDWDQQIKVEIVLDKKTMLPQYLKITRFHSLTVNNKLSGQNGTSYGEYATAYTFNWLPAR